MEFVSGICPNCKGELKLPKDRETILCMYCGTKILVSQGIKLKEDAQQELIKPLEFDQTTYETLYSQALIGLCEMLFSMERPMNLFTKKDYPSNFNGYCDKYSDVLNACMDASFMHPNPQGFFDELSFEFAKKAKETVDLIEKKREREDRQLDYNLTLVTFLFPSILEEKNKSAKLLAQSILDAWKKQFPTTNLELATFDQIDAGFKKRFCFITTAVCESLGKEDNCMELIQLRSYRDQYLLSSSEGEQLVREYYDIAPTIVKHINQSTNANIVYQEIYQNYLSVCLALIQEKRTEECRKVYQNMVYELKNRYFTS